MKLLISGATGFVGKHLVTKLIKDGHNICAIIRPSTQKKSINNQKIQSHIFDGNIKNLIIFLQKNHFDGVIHLASLFLAQHQSKDIKELISSNLLFSTSLLEACAKSGIPWFINTGTFWQHYNNKKYSPVNLYAATKQAFEDIAKYYIETSNINFVTIKLNDTFGPGDTRPKLMNLWMKISKTNETIDISRGEQLIEISYIDNVTDGYMRMINLLSRDKKRKFNGQSFAIKSDKRISLRKLADLFEKATNSKLNINWGKKEYRPREVMIPWKKGKTIPGWKPKVSLEEGIKRTFKEFITP